MGNNNLKGSLELNWINKDKSLFFEIDETEGIGVKPIWVEKDDIRVSEPRNLKLVEEFGDPDNENMLIRGDNLLALRTLVEEFKNRDEKDKVKCIYIDPPFNTGSAFKSDYYRDNLEHSQWLTMMRDRLVLLKQLLRKDGVIFVHIDSRETAHLKLLLDERFNRNNLIGFITLKVKDPAGVGQESPIFDVCEYILAYANDISKVKTHIAKTAYDYLEIKTPVKGYYRALTDPGTSTLVKTIDRQNVGKIKIKKCKNYSIKNLKKSSFSDYIKHYNTIFADYNPSGGMILAIKNQLPERGLSYIEYTPTKGKHAGKLTKVYFHNRRILAWLKDIVEKKEGKLVKRTKMTNLWVINTAGLPTEGNVYFPKSKKPEALIKKILDICTDKGDLVLDSFAGSGTTGAVAHKMGRKWIMIELGKHIVESKCKKRFRGVISKKNPDQTGISKEVCWKGGGGFRYYVVGDSLIRGSDMNWELTYKEIARALFRMFDYSFVGRLEDEIYLGRRKGRYALSIASKDLDMIKNEDVGKIIESVKEKYKNLAELEVYTNKGVGIKEEDLPDGVRIKKIPESILRKYKL